MVNRNDADGDALLQRVIEHLRQQAIPEFPDPEIAASTIAARPCSSARSISPLRRIIMNRRFQLSAGALVGVAALLGFLVLWGAVDAKSLSAMEQMAENIRKTKSHKYNLTVRIAKDFPQPGETPVAEYKHVLYKLASGSSRIEHVGGSDWKQAGPEGVEIDLVGKPGIAISHRDKSFYRLLPRELSVNAQSLDNLENPGQVCRRSRPRSGHQTDQRQESSRLPNRHEEDRQ